MASLDVEVDFVIYPPASAENADWFVFKSDQGKCSGNMGWRPEEGEALTLTGTWGAYKGDRVFKFKTAIPNFPTSPRDLLRYACKRTVGMGTAIEEAIWETKGAEWATIQPGEVPRYTPAVHGALMETLDTLSREKEKTNAIGYLMSKGATDVMATAAWERWGKDTVGVVKSNPYRLAELKHFSFLSVDKSIRMTFGITDDDPRRIRACVKYAMRMLTDDGSTVVEWSELQSIVFKYMGSNGLRAHEHVRDMFDKGELVGLPDTKEIALSYDYKCEETIWRFVQ